MTNSSRPSSNGRYLFALTRGAYRAMSATSTGKPPEHPTREGVARLGSNYRHESKIQDEEIVVAGSFGLELASLYPHDLSESIP